MDAYAASFGSYVTCAAMAAGWALPALALGAALAAGEAGWGCRPRASVATASALAVPAVLCAGGAAAGGIDMAVAALSTLCRLLSKPGGGAADQPDSPTAALAAGTAGGVALYAAALLLILAWGGGRGRWPARRGWPPRPLAAALADPPAGGGGGGAARAAAPARLHKPLGAVTAVGLALLGAGLALAVAEALTALSVPLSRRVVEAVGQAAARMPGLAAGMACLLRSGRGRLAAVGLLLVGPNLVPHQTSATANGGGQSGALTFSAFGLTVAGVMAAIVGLGTLPLEAAAGSGGGGGRGGDTGASADADAASHPSPSIPPPPLTRAQRVVTGACLAAAVAGCVPAMVGFGVQTALMVKFMSRRAALLFIMTATPTVTVTLATVAHAAWRGTTRRPGVGARGRLAAAALLCVPAQAALYLGTQMAFAVGMIGLSRATLPAFVSAVGMFLVYAGCSAAAGWMGAVLKEGARPRVSGGAEKAAAGPAARGP